MLTFLQLSSFSKTNILTKRIISICCELTYSHHKNIILSNSKHNKNDKCDNLENNGLRVVCIL